MKSTKIIFVMLAWLGLQSLSGLIAQEKQQIDTTSLMSVENNRDSFWQLTPDGRSIFFNDGYVGVGTSAPFFMLDVEGDVGTTKLTIKQAYSLPTTSATKDHFLNGLGEWSVPAGGGGGGDCFWEGDLGAGIFYNKGNVGIGTSANNANARLQVVGNLNVGENPHATIGKNAFVGGTNSWATGDNSFAFGDEAKATHSNAFAVGLRAEASGKHSTAFGRASKASNENAIALGYVAEATTPNSIVIGTLARVTAGNSYLIGSGTGTGTGMIVNNIGYSFMIGMKSNIPSFFVGPSNGAGTTGSIGIGNMTDPQAKLHIYSDVDKAATLKLEHRTTGANRYAEIGLGTHSIRAGNTENMVFSTPATNRHFVFENGNVGIGVSNPQRKLMVAGDIDFTGSLLNNGQAFTGSNWVVNAGGSIYRLDGNVGIGVNNPQRRLVVAGDIEFTGDLYTNGQIFEGGSNWTEKAGNIYRLDGKVGIGIINSFDHLLAVNGSILATEVVIRHPSNWYDHVFEDGYKLMSLDQLEEFVSKNKHLPDIPTEKDVMAEGFQLGELSALLLKKIEELTLYTIQQQKLIEKQQELLERLMEID